MVFVKDREVDQETLEKITFATLPSILPTLERKNIHDVRALPSRDTSLGDRTETSSGQSQNLGRLPSCIVTLTSQRHAENIMRAKRSLSNNYFTTKDIHATLLKSDTYKCIPDRKILINELLPQQTFRLFNELKPVAKNLGFKFVWHSRGRFLVRWRAGERAHHFSSISDLRTIADIYLMNAAPAQTDLTSATGGSPSLSHNFQASEEHSWENNASTMPLSEHNLGNDSASKKKGKKRRTKSPSRKNRIGKTDVTA